MTTTFWRGKRVLVTGHTGFKGAWLSLILKNLGSIVAGFSLPSITTPSLFNELSNDASQHLFDLSDIGDIRKDKLINHTVSSFQPQIIIHLAAQPLVSEGYLDPLGTWSTNLIGSLNVLESCKALRDKCSIVVVTTDKVYHNNEWHYGYRENDRLGGYDPYSASKAACELAVDSWRNSFVGKHLDGAHPNLRIATARAGNVIGGGDWSTNRILPDLVRAFVDGHSLCLRAPYSRRPWQHVIEPLWGYLRLAELLYCAEPLPCESFNFGPYIESNTTVLDLVKKVEKCWDRSLDVHIQSVSPRIHEAQLLHLNIDKAINILDWRPQWDLDQAIFYTSNWYYKFHEKGYSALDCCNSDIEDYLCRLLDSKEPAHNNR